MESLFAEKSPYGGIPLTNPENFVNLSSAYFLEVPAILFFVYPANTPPLYQRSTFTYNIYSKMMTEKSYFWIFYFIIRLSTLIHINIGCQFCIGFCRITFRYSELILTQMDDL